MQANVLPVFSFLMERSAPVGLRRFFKYATVTLSLIPGMILFILIILTFVPFIDPTRSFALILTMNIFFVLQMIMRRILRMSFKTKLCTLSIIAEIMWIIALVN